MLTFSELFQFLKSLKYYLSQLLKYIHLFQVVEVKNFMLVLYEYTLCSSTQDTAVVFFHNCGSRDDV